MKKQPVHMKCFVLALGVMMPLEVQASIEKGDFTPKNIVAGYSYCENTDIIMDSIADPVFVCNPVLAESLLATVLCACSCHCSCGEVHCGVDCGDKKDRDSDQHYQPDDGEGARQRCYCNCHCTACGLCYCNCDCGACDCCGGLKAKLLPKEMALII